MQDGHFVNGFEIRMEGRSDRGLMRGNNEDYLDWDVGRGLAVLADGVGGCNAGEVASRMAVTTMLEQVPLPTDDASAQVCTRQLREVIAQANLRIHESARYAPFVGMSTTLAVLWLCGQQVVLAHVGDSRIYRFRNGLLRQMTVDHSLVQELIDSCVLSPEEARGSTKRHIITRALGAKETVEVEVSVAALHSGDRYLLCSDGLSDMVDEETMAALLQGTQPLSSMIDALIEQANLRGGEDNIAVLLVAID